MGVNSFINCLASLVAPVVVNIFVRDDTWDEWWYVWIVHGVLLTLCNIYFILFGKAEPAEWTKGGYGSKVAPEAQIPPRSHPRIDRYSMRLNDRISVSVQTVGLSPCDTCRGGTPSIITDDRNDTSPIPIPRKSKQSRMSSQEIFEDYLSAESEAHVEKTPENCTKKIIVPSHCVDSIDQ
ncbi:hypothetical protein DICVIV_11994 [Dictyocaulus viviparus]|uniref:Uncharacterized protein n=1 Tax=Dictyocaulus viviparus TaxID=29172 RepID=A0A0D8XI69_DICVI|nr:hypothetical protein DICVIV_11994 [Dictyocaulus viviparus]